MEAQFIGAAEAAALLQIKTRTLYQLIAAGKIPYYKPVRKLLFSPSELADYIQHSRVGTTAERRDEADRLFAKMEQKRRRA